MREERQHLLFEATVLFSDDLYCFRTLEGRFFFVSMSKIIVVPINVVILDYQSRKEWGRTVLIEVPPDSSSP